MTKNNRAVGGRNEMRLWEVWCGVCGEVIGWTSRQDINNCYCNGKCSEKKMAEPLEEKK